MRRTALADGRADGPPPTLEPADVELGLRYVPDFRVLVLAAPELPSLLAAAAEAAGFAGAHLIVIAPPRATLGELPAASTVVTAARGEQGDGGLAALVASYAVALDAGEDSARAWRKATDVAGASSLA